MRIGPKQCANNSPSPMTAKKRWNMRGMMCEMLRNKAGCPPSIFPLLVNPIVLDPLLVCKGHHHHHHHHHHPHLAPQFSSTPTHLESCHIWHSRCREGLIYIELSFEGSAHTFLRAKNHRPVSVAVYGGEVLCK